MTTERRSCEGCRWFRHYTKKLHPGFYCHSDWFKVRWTMQWIDEWVEREPGCWEEPRPRPPAEDEGGE